MTTPTITKMVKLYLDAAEIERIKSGRPGANTVRNTLQGVKRFRIWLNKRRAHLGYEHIGLDEDFPLVSIVKPNLIHKYLADMLKSGTNPLTAISYINQFQQLFAKWMKPYYDDAGWKIPDFPSISHQPIAPRYNRPSPELLNRVKEWYNALFIEERVFRGRRRLVDIKEVRFAATMMLEFAMRNSDIARLKPTNFVMVGSDVLGAPRHFLNYTPHKTAHSSGRMVKWPIHPHIWEELSKGLPTIDADTFEVLNKEMRALGFTGTKGAYELRKICIDHVYQKYGAEMAVSISGDNIKTIMHYYADPAQPNIGAVRIIDLL